MNHNYQNLILLLGTLAERNDVVVWIRTPDYRHQLYVSPGFSKIWERDPSVLYEDPLKWGEFLVDDERAKTVFEACARNPSTLDPNRNTNYYRINRPNSHIAYIKDTCFHVHNSQNELIAIAGTAIELTQKQWERNVAQMESGETNKEIATILSILEKNQGDKLPPTMLNDDLPYQYLFLRDGDYTALSPREWSTLKHLLDGLSAKETARKLDISYRTVEIHLDKLKKKLNCRNKGELFRTIHPASLDLLRETE